MTTIDNFSGESYVRKVLLENIANLITQGFDYIAFNIITQGIEAIGCFYDISPFDQQGLSKKRFEKGLSLLGVKYDPIKESLYKNLRCGMAHQLVPLNDISLTSYKSGATDAVHLKKGDRSGNTYLVVDSFFNDFTAACETLINDISDPSYSGIPADKKTMNRLSVIATAASLDPTTGKLIEATA